LAEGLEVENEASPEQGRSYLDLDGSASSGAGAGAGIDGGGRDL